MSETQEAIWLTQEAYDKLQAELEYLETDGRHTVSAKIAAARDEGDLSENGGYHAAREEQGQMESRILQLKQMLRDAQVGEAPDEASGVSVGAKIIVSYFHDDQDTEEFLLGSREMLKVDDSVNVQVYSPQSPLGSAVLGAKVGETVTYQAPTGKTIEVTVQSIEGYAN